MLSVKNLTNDLDVAFGTSGVRGLVKDLTPAICFAFVKAFLQVNTSPSKLIALGIDLRPSSLSMAKSCIAAINAHGCEVVYCGELPTPALAFYAMSNKMPCIMITGSHIPFSRNGLKFYNIDSEISKLDEVNILNSEVQLPDGLDESVKNIQIPTINPAALEAYRQRYTELFPVDMLKGKRIGIYEHSSVARDVLKDLMSYFGAEVISLERTDYFVPIDTEAVSAIDKEKAKEWAKKYQLDAIISTDGDGDRPLISDENGQWLRGDVLGVLCVNYLGATHVAAPINVNSMLDASGDNSQLICSRTCIGSPYVIAAMQDLAKEVLASKQKPSEPKKESVVSKQKPSASSSEASAIKIVGYEANGGFMVGSDIPLNGKTLHALPTRDAVLPILIILSLAHQRPLPISDLLKDLPARFTASACIKDVLKDVSDKITDSLELDKIKQDAFLFEVYVDKAIKINTINKTDGLRLFLSNKDIIHIRPSGNAPELRVYIETSTMDKSEGLVELVIETLKKLYVYENNVKS
jgi:phosphomannomutase